MSTGAWVMLLISWGCILLASAYSMVKTLSSGGGTTESQAVSPNQPPPTERREA